MELHKGSHCRKVRLGGGLLVACCGGLAALPHLASLPSGFWFERAARGLSPETFAVQAGVLDWLAAGLWRLGGVPCLALLPWVGSWLAWVLVFGAILGWGVRWGWRRGGWLRWVATGCAGLLCTFVVARGVWLAVLAWEDPAKDPRLWLPSSEALVLSKQGARVFASPTAIVPLVLAGIHPVPGPEVAWGAMRTVSEWRAQLRDHGWDAVLLAGNGVESGQLLDHLLTAPDWQFVSVSPVGWLFLRGSGPDNPLPQTESLDLGRPQTTALALARLAMRLDTMQALPEARHSMMRALELAPESSEVQIQAAGFSARRRRWQDVISHSRAALRRDPHAASAHALLALGLLESRNAQAAVEAARDAVRADREDPQARLLLARAQRASRDFLSEIETLSGLIALLRKTGQPTAVCLSYLGQAHAQTGNAREAKAAYHEALASGELSPEQTAAVQGALTIIESRSNFQTVEP